MNTVIMALMVLAVAWIIAVIFNAPLWGLGIVTVYVALTDIAYGTRGRVVDRNPPTH